MIKFGDATATSAKDAPAPKKAAAPQPMMDAPATDLLDGDLTGAGDKPKPAKKRFGAKAAKPAKPAA